MRGVDFDLRTVVGYEVAQLVPEVVWQSHFDATGDDVRESFEERDNHPEPIQDAHELRGRSGPTKIRLQSATVASLPAALARAAKDRAAWGFVYMIASDRERADHVLGFYVARDAPPLFVDPQNPSEQRVFTDLKNSRCYGRLRKDIVGFLVCSGQPQPMPRTTPAALKRANNGAGAPAKRVCVMQIVKKEEEGSAGGELESAEALLRLGSTGP